MVPPCVPRNKEQEPVSILCQYSIDAISNAAKGQGGCLQAGGAKMAPEVPPRCTNAPNDHNVHGRGMLQMRFGAELIDTRKLQIHLQMIIPTDDYTHFSGDATVSGFA